MSVHLFNTANNRVKNTYVTTLDSESILPRDGQIDSNLIVFKRELKQELLKNELKYRYEECTENEFFKVMKKIKTAKEVDVFHLSYCIKKEKFDFNQWINILTTIIIPRLKSNERCFLLLKVMISLSNLLSSKQKELLISAYSSYADDNCLSLLSYYFPETERYVRNIRKGSTNILVEQIESLVDRFEQRTKKYFNDMNLLLT